MKRSNLLPLMCLLLLLALNGCGTLQQRSALPESLVASLAQTGIPASSVALDIRSVDGERLVAHNADVALQPASVMKLVTTAASLDLLGPGYRWITRLHASGDLRNGTLHGDLIIEGGGDPRFAHEDLARLLRRLRWMGVHEIRGDLVQDSSLFAPAVADPAAFDAAPERAYNALPDALLLDAKALSVSLIPDPTAQYARLSAEPPMSDFVIEPPVQNDQPCVRWREQLKPVLTARSLRFEGSFPVSCGERLLTLHLHTVSNVDYVDTVFRQLWLELGGTITGVSRAGRVPANARELLIWESMTLAEIIRDINKHSNNVMARQLLLSLATIRGGAPASPEMGAARVRDWLAAYRIDAKSVIIDNGSGLSRHERISVDVLSSVLQQVWHSPLMPEFIASLPLVGIDGTMERRLQESSVRGHAHIKTGTLMDVTSIAGYVAARSGRRIIVSCIINDVNAPAARPALDALLQWIHDRY